MLSDLVVFDDRVTVEKRTQWKGKTMAKIYMLINLVNVSKKTEWRFPGEGLITTIT
jgi:hypothetical protein